MDWTGRAERKTGVHQLGMNRDGIAQTNRCETRISLGFSDGLRQLDQPVIEQNDTRARWMTAPRVLLGSTSPSQQALELPITILEPRCSLKLQHLSSDEQTVVASGNRFQGCP